VKETQELRRRIALCVSQTLAIYCFAGWVYIALAALIQPNTLGLKLTHFANFPHEDTFGEACFAISALSFFFYSLLRNHDKEASARSNSHQRNNT
jgi:uncharacterized membrane protein